MLSWLKQIGVEDLELEFDLMSAVLALNSNVGGDLSYFGMAVDDCRTLLNDFCNVKVSFIHRSTNLLAHSLCVSAGFSPDVCS